VIASHSSDQPDDALDAARRQRERTRWSRLAIRDLLLITLCYALALAWIGRQPPDEREATWELLVMVFLLGGVLAAPLVLGSQYLVGGRRAALSVGEFIWLAQPTLWIALWLCGQLMPSAGLALFMLFVLAELLISVVALGNLFVALFWTPPVDHCVWTDRFGSCISALVGPWLILDLYLHPIII
jgi:hypothetical protein